MFVPEETLQPAAEQSSALSEPPPQSLSGARSAALLPSLLPSLLPYFVLVLVFVLAGLTGHDPWKADEAYVFGVVHEMLESGDWIVPRLAGEQFMEKPPLFYWTAAAFARLFSPWLPLHDGARLAAGFFMAVALGAVGTAARIWWGAGTGRYAVLIMIAYVGILVQSHMMMPDISLLAGFALSALGFAIVLGKPVRGGALLGLGAGMGFMSKGILAPGVMGLTMLLLPACFKAWRQRFYWRGLGVAALVSAPWCLLWPIALYGRSPELFREWFWLNNLGRFLGFSVNLLGAEHLPWFWTQTIPWFTFPGLPLAVWALWRARGTAPLAQPAVQYALIAFGVLMTVLAVSSSARCIYAWPLLVPITLLASPAAAFLPKRLDRAWAWCGLVLFGAVAMFVWLVWALMMWKGAPPAWPFLLRVLPAEYVPRFDAGSVTAAVLLTVGGLMAWRTYWRQPAPGLMTWSIGITLAWSVLMTLLTPWLDFAKSYRSVFASITIPEGVNCIAGLRFGESERAMLRYVSGHNIVRLETSPNAGCTMLMLQREAAEGEPDIDLTKWREVWRGSRPGITNERFWLFQSVH